MTLHNFYRANENLKNTNNLYLQHFDMKQGDIHGLVWFPKPTNAHYRYLYEVFDNKN